MPECGCFHEYTLEEVAPGTFRLTTQTEGMLNLGKILEQSGLAKSVTTEDGWLQTSVTLEGVAQKEDLESFVESLSSVIVVRLSGFAECYALRPYTVFDENEQHQKTVVGLAINRAKYWGDANVGPKAGKILADFIGRHPRMRQATLVTYPPSSTANQIGLARRMAETISEESGLKLVTLEKKRQTDPQKDLPEGIDAQGAVDRIADSIVAPDIPAGAIVVIVDDTIRSGGTMLDSARALKEKGASEVYGLSLAKDAKFTYGGVDLSKERWS